MKKQKQEECLFDKMAKDCNCKYCSKRFERASNFKWWIILIIALGILLYISLSSAMYAGECSQIDLSDLENPSNVVYTVVDNSSNMEGMNITNNGTFVDVCFDLAYKPDNFTLVFMDKITEQVVQEVVVYRGGGSRTKYVENKTVEYIDVERTVYVNSEPNCTSQEEIVIEEERAKFFSRVWSWIKGVFGK